MVDREPDWEPLPHNLPAVIRRVLQRCLEKDARRRLRDIGDARLEIEGALLRADEIAQIVTGISGHQSNSRLAWRLVMIFALGFVAATVGAIALYVQGERADTRVIRFAAGFPEGWTPGPTRDTSPAGVPGVNGSVNLAVSPGEASHVQPSFLPDGRHFLYRTVNAAANRRPVYVATVDSSDRMLVMSGVEGAARVTANVIYSRQHLLFLSGNTLMAQPFDERRLTTTGDAIPIAENVRRFEPSPFDAGYLYFDVKLSPRGDQVAVTRQDPGRLADIWLYDVTRNGRRPFTSDPRMDRVAIWSPDGSRIVFGASRGASHDLYHKTTDSSDGQESPLLEAPLTQIPEDWSPDGQAILYGTNAPSGRRDLWVLPMSGDRKPMPLLHGSAGKVSARFSPDGRWIAYQSNESGRLEVYVAPFRKNGATRQISTDGGNIPRWRRDGTELFFLDAVNGLVAASVDGGGVDFKVHGLRRLFQTRAKLGVYGLEVSPDGERFLINTVVQQRTASFTVVVNWQAALTN